MAQIKDIFGAGISGKLNQVVFYQRKGKTFVRALPIRKNKTDSPAQQLNKQRFGAMLRFAQQFKYVLIPQIWNPASKSLTGTQLFMKTNKGAFDAEGQLTDPRAVQLSKTQQNAMLTLFKNSRHWSIVCLYHSSLLIWALRNLR